MFDLFWLLTFHFWLIWYSTSVRRNRSLIEVLQPGS